MAGIDFGLIQANPIAQQKQAYSYADMIGQNAAKYQAGGQYAAGDYAGAAKTQAQAGNIDQAQAIQEQGQKSAEAVHSYITQALPVFQKILQVHASDPDGGKQAIGQAFDSVAPEISQLTGHNDVAIGQLRQSLVNDPQGTLQRIQAMVPVKYSNVAPGGTVLRQQGNAAPEAVFSAPALPKTPAVHSFTEGDKTVEKQFNPETGQWDELSSGPRYKPVAVGGNTTRLMTDDEKQAAGLPSQGVYQIDGKGKIDRVSGNNSVRQIPGSALAGILANKNTLRKIDAAIAALKTPEGRAAMGLHNYAGDDINQRVDPKGVPARALIADIGSQKLHDRSGAAVTASESPRLKPFIPAVTDTPEVAIQKLLNLKAEYDSNVDEAESFYSPEAGYMSLPGGAGPAQSQAAPASADGWSIKRVK